LNRRRQQQIDLCLALSPVRTVRGDGHSALHACVVHQHCQPTESASDGVSETGPVFCPREIAVNRLTTWYLGERLA